MLARIEFPRREAISVRRALGVTTIQQGPNGPSIAKKPKQCFGRGRSVIQSAIRYVRFLEHSFLTVSPGA